MDSSSTKRKSMTPRKKTGKPLESADTTKEPTPKKTKKVKEVHGGNTTATTSATGITVANGTTTSGAKDAVTDKGIAKAAKLAKKKRRMEKKQLEKKDRPPAVPSPTPPAATAARKRRGKSSTRKKPPSGDLVTIGSEARGSRLHCCRPVFLDAPSSSSSSPTTSQDPVLLCGYGPSVRGASVRTGEWLWGIDSSSGSAVKSNAHKLSSGRGPVGQVAGLAEEVTALAVTPDGAHILVGTAQGSVTTWTSSTAATAAAGRSASLFLASGGNGHAEAAARLPAWAAAGLSGGAGGIGAAQDNNGFAVSGWVDLGAPVLSLSACPVSTAPHTLTSVHGPVGSNGFGKASSGHTTPLTRVYAVLGRPFPNKNDAGVGSVSGGGGGSDSGGGGGGNRDWSVAALTVTGPGAGDNGGGAGSGSNASKKTALLAEVVFTCTCEIFGLALHPMPSSAFAASAVAAASAAASASANGIEVDGDEEQGGDEKQRKKKSETQAQALQLPPDVVVCTARELVVLPGDPNSPCAVWKQAESSNGTAATSGWERRTCRRPKPKHVPYPDDSNPAFCVAAQQPSVDDAGFGGGEEEAGASFSGGSSGGAVATGHQEGEIYVWYGLLERGAGHFAKAAPSSSSKGFANGGGGGSSSSSNRGRRQASDRGATAAPPPTNVRRLQPLHWHASAVSALCWAPGGGGGGKGGGGGDCLLSGGFEGVLVVWNLEGVVPGSNGAAASSGASSSASAAVSAGRPSFLPRLGGAVSHIQVSPDGAAATVSTTNNVMRLVSLADRERRWAVRGVSTSLQSAPLPPAPNSWAPSSASASSALSLKAALKKKGLFAGTNPVSSLAVSASSTCEDDGAEGAVNDAFDFDDGDDCDGGSAVTQGVSLLTAEPPLWSAWSTNSTSALKTTMAADGGAASSSLGSCRLLLNGQPGALQFFDCFLDKVSDASLEVVPHNFNVVNSLFHNATASKAQKRGGGGAGAGGGAGGLGPVPVVTHAFFGSLGSVLVTVDGWHRTATTQLPSSSSSKRANGKSKGKSNSVLNSAQAAAAAVTPADVLLGAEMTSCGGGVLESTERPNLKFWHRSQRAGSGGRGSGGHDWKLVSLLASPHGSCAVTALAAHPTLHALAASGASDGSLKVWKVKSTESTSSGSSSAAAGGGKSKRQDKHQALRGGGGNKNGQGDGKEDGGGGVDESWVCGAVIGWHKGQRIGALAFSQDGSLLAVASGKALIALWDPHGQGGDGKGGGGARLLRTMVVPGYAGMGMGMAAARGGVARLAFMSAGLEESFACAAVANKLSSSSSSSILRLPNHLDSPPSSSSSSLTTTTQPPTMKHPLAPTKLLVVSGGSVGVWDLLKLAQPSPTLLHATPDWQYLLPVAASAVLPPHASQPYAVCVPVYAASSTAATTSKEPAAATSVTAAGGRVEREVTGFEVRVATVAVAVRSSEGKAAVALFGTSSPAPVFVFTLDDDSDGAGGGDNEDDGDGDADGNGNHDGSPSPPSSPQRPRRPSFTVKSLEWVVRESDGVPLGVACLSTNLELRFLSVAHHHHGNGQSAAAAYAQVTGDHLSNPLPLAAAAAAAAVAENDGGVGGRDQQQRRRSALADIVETARGSGKQTKRVKISGVDDVDSAEEEEAAVTAAQSAVPSSSTSTPFLKLVPSTNLPAPAALFTSFLRHQASAGATTTPAGASAAMELSSADDSSDNSDNEYDKEDGDEDNQKQGSSSAPAPAAAAGVGGATGELFGAAVDAAAADPAPWMDFFKSHLSS